MMITIIMMKKELSIIASLIVYNFNKIDQNNVIYMRDQIEDRVIEEFEKSIHFEF